MTGQRTPQRAADRRDYGHPAQVTCNFKYTVWVAAIENYGFLCALSGLSDFSSPIEGPKMPRGASSAALRSDPKPPKNSCNSSSLASVPGDPKRPHRSVPEQPVCCLGPPGTPSMCGNRHGPLGAAVAAVGPSDPPKPRTVAVCHSVKKSATCTLQGYIMYARSAPWPPRRPSTSS